MKTSSEIIDQSLVVVVVLFRFVFADIFVPRKKPPNSSSRPRDGDSVIGILLVAVGFGKVWSLRRPVFTPLIGTRTWGGLIGISCAPGQIDGGSVTLPTFRMYNPDGTWFKKGHGVDPDIAVDDDPSQLAKGVDPQLGRGIQEVMKLVKDHPPVWPKQPAYEKR